MFASIQKRSNVQNAMKHAPSLPSFRITAACLIAVLSFIGRPAPATDYTDPANDISATIGQSGSHIDLTGLTITNDASNLYFVLSAANGNISSPNWGKYMIGIDSVPGGDTTGNGWGRPISMSSGMDSWIGIWTDNTDPAQIWTYSGSWSQTGTAAKTLGNSLLVVASLASLNLSPGDTFTFDVYSSGGGGGDGAVDALANPNVSIGWWSDPYDSGANVYSYTVAVVPEPSAIVLAGLGVLALAICRRSRR
jgi:hypothetical protein